MLEYFPYCGDSLTGEMNSKTAILENGPEGPWGCHLLEEHLDCNMRAPSMHTYLNCTQLLWPLIKRRPLALTGSRYREVDPSKRSLTLHGGPIEHWFECQE
ncbi:hypothetical protein HPP92_026274 [Vanilla planifolia]|uniref:Uncharacterized protein n=1 Tax=Vanilla planifolia TaxID=51239 RepID=A0A835PDN5_VANPL|nr:hypothetical protein HPP92_026274 [Vanilla planifolia]